jgi:hypothetical protein
MYELHPLGALKITRDGPEPRPDGGPLQQTVLAMPALHADSLSASTSTSPRPKPPHPNDDASQGSDGECRRAPLA